MLQRVAACEDLAQLVKPESGFSRSFPQNSTYLFNPTEFLYPQPYISQIYLCAHAASERNASRFAFLLHTLSPPEEPSISHKRALHLPKKKTRYPQKSHISRTLLSAKEPYISRTIIRVLWGGYD